MKLIKIILALLGIVFGAMLFLWLFGFVTSLLWYGFWIALIAGAGYGAYRLFASAEKKYVTGGSAYGEIEDRDFSLSWEEYDKKYLNK